MHLGLSDITTVDHVENLEENEQVKDQGEMLHLIFCHSVVSVDQLCASCVIYIENFLSSMDGNNHNTSHVHEGEDNLAIHLRCHDLSLRGEVLMSDISGRTGSSKCKRTKDIHDEVNIDKLDGVEARFSLGSITENDHEHASQGAGDLEL